MPCDYSKYPANWLTEIRPRILERAGNRCEKCGAANYEPHPITGSRVVLTIAHLHDPDPSNCDDDNLAALCQRCHNRLDAPMRAANRRKTLARKSGQLSLFDT
jgi:5-methylcytosine-specific restriction endonuclease McrA